MEQSTQGQDNQNSLESAKLLSTLEERLRHSFGSLTSPPRLPDSNGGLARVEFQPLPVRLMTEEDVKALDKARLSGSYLYDFTVEEFVGALQRNDYDVWKLAGVSDCLCILLTTYELYPHSRHLMVHYLCGKNCRKHMKEIKGAVKQLMLNGNCEKIVYMAPSEAYAKVIGGKRLAVFYEMTED